MMIHSSALIEISESLLYLSLSLLLGTQNLLKLLTSSVHPALLREWQNVSMYFQIWDISVTLHFISRSVKIETSQPKLSCHWKLDMNLTLCHLVTQISRIFGCSSVDSQILFRLGLVTCNGGIILTKTWKAGHGAEPPTLTAVWLESKFVITSSPVPAPACGVKGRGTPSGSRQMDWEKAHRHTENAGVGRPGVPAREGPSTEPLPGLFFSAEMEDGETQIVAVEHLPSCDSCLSSSKQVFSGLLCVNSASLHLHHPEA